MPPLSMEGSCSTELISLNVSQYFTLVRTGRNSVADVAFVEADQCAGLTHPSYVRGEVQRRLVVRQMVTSGSMP